MPVVAIHLARGHFLRNFRSHEAVKNTSPQYPKVIIYYALSRVIILQGHLLVMMFLTILPVTNTPGYQVVLRVSFHKVNIFEEDLRLQRIIVCQPHEVFASSLCESKFEVRQNAKVFFVAYVPHFRMFPNYLLTKFLGIIG